jgi:cystathionine beta-lyase
MNYNFDVEMDRKNTGSFKWDWCHQIFGTDDLIPMSIADMDIPVPPQVIQAIHKRNEHPVFGYTVRTDSYFKSVINWMNKRYNWEVDKDWILSTPGIVPAISFAVFSFTEPGDKILIQPPVYHPFFDAIELNKRILIENPLKEIHNGGKIHYEIDFEDLEAKLDGVKMMILCSPHNPVGRVWTREELDRIGKICKAKGVIILSDEIHSDLIYKPFKHIPFSSLTDFQEVSLTCMAPSKTFNVAGLCASVVIIPNQQLRDRFLKSMFNCGVFLGNVFGNVVLETCYNDCEDWLENLLDYLKQCKSDIEKFFELNLPQLKVADTEATFLTWIDFRNLNFKTHEELEKFIIEKAKIGLDTGSKFGEQGKFFMRLNFGCNRKTINEALIRLKSAIDQL